MVYICKVSKVILVGTISNAENQVEKDFSRVYKSLHFFEEIYVFLVESDSSDSTIDVLNKLSKKIPNFYYVSLGELKTQLPNRIERIRKCRNEYVDHIRNNIEPNKWDYVVVADLDGMNSSVEYDSILNLFSSRTSWDACFPNQRYGYYDLYALREKSWMPRDVFEDLKVLRSSIPVTELKKFQIFKKFKRLLAFDKARKLSIYSKMRKISKNDPWISVDSAFGGLAIYKTNLFLDNNYDSDALEGPLVSEHVDFNLKCTSSGAKFFIVPSFINSNWNEYNINRLFIVRQIRQFFGNHKKLRELLLKLSKS